MKRKKLLSMFLAVVMVISTVAAMGIQMGATSLQIKDINETLELSDYNDEELTKMSIADMLTPTEVIAATTFDDSIAPMSLLPLEEIEAYLVLYDKTEEISSMLVNDVLSMLVDRDGNSIPIASDATTVWKYVTSNEDGIEEYEEYSIDKDGIITDDELIDLSIGAEVNSYVMELIVGTGKQLSSSNKRYIIKVYISDNIEDQIEFELYTQSADGTRIKITPDISSVSTTTNALGWQEINTRFRISSHVAGTEYYLGATSTEAELPYINVKVYDFLGYFLGDDPIDGQLLFQDMRQKDTGYKSTSFDSTGGTFVFEYTDTRTNAVTTKAVEFQIYNKDAVIGHMCSFDNGTMKSNSLLVDNSVNFNWDNLLPDDKTFVQTRRNRLYMLDEGLKVDDEYYFYLDISDSQYGPELGNFNSHVIKAVVGQYDTIEEASESEDIKEYLTPTNKSTAPYGYKANYDHSNENRGITFTIFYDDKTKLTMTVGVIEYNPLYDPLYMREFTDKPIIGEADPWFRVTGTSDSNNVYDIYVIENGKSINMDTYYGYGYQTIFINDKNVDLSQLKPTFWFGNADRVETYAVSQTEGNKQISGESVRDFSKGMLQYGTIIDTNEKNYQVTFVKKETGAKLFVNGPSERSVFLDEYFEYKHDILIANIGDQPLTGLNVELNATNVKLDDYWTVGGTGNNTLAAFTTTLTDTQYGELANIAKIRLLPDGEGEIEGTLTITADDQEPVVINLSGRAKNPSIVTEMLDDAVKYVPYSYLLATDNMNDWNEVTFQIESGELPEGIELFSTTGEIYGVAREIGEFHILVKASYSHDDYFDPSYADLTLVVKDNTNDTVYNASDEGYQIIDSIGEDMNDDHNFILREIGDQVFRSAGELSNFVDFWLNGEKLVEGVDYDKSEGSTRITIIGQTFEDKANRDSSNTIAAEFRIDGDLNNDLRRTAQNFTIDLSYTDNPIISDDSSNGDFIAPEEDSNNKGNDNQGDDNSDTNNGVISDNSDSPETLTSTDNSDGNVDDFNSANQPQENQNGGDNQLSVGSVNIFAGVVDANGNAVTGLSVEFHSDVKTAVTDDEGKFEIYSTEFGSHTLILKNEAQGLYSEKKFDLIKGDTFTVKDDTVIAPNGASISLNIVLDGNIIRFANVNDTKVDTGNVNNANEDKAVPTGVVFPSCVAVAVLSAMGLIVLNVRRKY